MYYVALHMILQYFEKHQDFCIQIRRSDEISLSADGEILVKASQSFHKLALRQRRTVYNARQACIWNVLLVVTVHAVIIADNIIEAAAISLLPGTSPAAATSQYCQCAPGDATQHRMTCPLLRQHVETEKYKDIRFPRDYADTIDTACPASN